MESSVPGLSLAAQPAALTMAVSFTDLVKPHLTVLRFDYNERAKILQSRDVDGNPCPRTTCAGAGESVLIA
jgi:hypothetical protein